MKVLSLFLAASVLAACASTPVRQAIDVPINDVRVEASLRDCDTSKPTKVPQRRAEFCLSGFEEPRGCYNDVEVGVYTTKLYDWAEHCSGDNRTLNYVIDAFNAAQAKERKIVQKAIEDAADVR